MLYSSSALAQTIFLWAKWRNSFYITFSANAEKVRSFKKSTILSLGSHHFDSRKCCWWSYQYGLGFLYAQYKVLYVLRHRVRAQWQNGEQYVTGNMFDTSRWRALSFLSLAHAACTSICTLRHLLNVPYCEWMPYFEYEPSSTVLTTSQYHLEEQRVNCAACNAKRTKRARAMRLLAGKHTVAYFSIYEARIMTSMLHSYTTNLCMCIACYACISIL